MALLAFDHGRALMIRQERAVAKFDTAARQVSIIKAVLAKIADHPPVADQGAFIAFMREKGGFSKLLLEEMGPAPDPKNDSFGPTNDDFHLWVYLRHQIPEMRCSIQEALQMGA